MKRGRKPDLPSVRALRGSSRSHRDADKVEIIGPDMPPVEPESLTEAGRAVWLGNIDRVAQARLVTELDSELFASYCNLQAAINRVWAAGDVPPTAHLSEARKMAEQFGIFGAKSRVVSGLGRQKSKGNSFGKF